MALKRRDNYRSYHEKVDGVTNEWDREAGKANVPNSGTHANWKGMRRTFLRKTSHQNLCDIKLRGSGGGRGGACALARSRFVTAVEGTDSGAGLALPARSVPGSEQPLAAASPLLYRDLRWQPFKRPIARPPRSLPSLRLAALRAVRRLLSQLLPKETGLLVGMIIRWVYYRCVPGSTFYCTSCPSSITTVKSVLGFLSSLKGPQVCILEICDKFFSQHMPSPLG